MAAENVTASNELNDLQSIIDRLFNILNPMGDHMHYLGEMLDLARKEYGESSLKIAAVTEAAHGFYDHLFEDMNKLSVFVNELQIASQKAGA